MGLANLVGNCGSVSDIRIDYSLLWNQASNPKNASFSINTDGINAIEVNCISAVATVILSDPTLATIDTVNNGQTKTIDVSSYDSVRIRAATAGYTTNGVLRIL